MQPQVATYHCLRFGFLGVYLVAVGVTLTDLMENIEKIQYHAALAVNGAWEGSSHSKLYEELEWESLSERR